MSAVVNTHVHVPPNFSAFSTPADVVACAQAQQVRVLGVSNFYDQQVYSLIRDLTQGGDILALYGLEFITLVPDLADQGIRVNDPSNPGRMYLTGKGIDPFRAPSPQAKAVAIATRQGNDQRADQMVSQLARHLCDQGFDTGLRADSIAETVARRAEVPLAWVSLQERHIAQAFQQALASLDPVRRAEVLAAAYGRPSMVDINNPAALQAEIRSRLLKVGTPGFVPEVPLSFDEARRYVLDMGGIPCYPVLADGASPVCEFEQSPQQLAAELIRRGIHAVELIPGRNSAVVAQSYVESLHEAGMIVMAGTEHNTLDRAPLDPTFADGPLSASTRGVFLEGTAVVVAHVNRVVAGQAGFVDPTGDRTNVAVADLVAEGLSVINPTMPIAPTMA
ncbi:MAG: hypothetical protein LBV00_05745 [Propionibacteriaceae bacterium]|jgi:hypothetical protein|nr:hypothetical protein [Propionibacteriaceae bacterium]